MLSDRCRAGLKRSIMLARERHQLWGFEATGLIIAFDLVDA